MGIPLERLKEIDSLLYSENDRLYAATFKIGFKWIKVNFSGGRNVLIRQAAESRLIWESAEARDAEKALDLERYRISRRMASAKLDRATPEILTKIENLLDEIQGSLAQ